jgi:hypothetical protein
VAPLTAAGFAAACGRARWCAVWVLRPSEPAGGAARALQLAVRAAARRDGRVAVGLRLFTADGATEPALVAALGGPAAGAVVLVAPRRGAVRTVPQVSADDAAAADEEAAAEMLGQRLGDALAAGSGDGGEVAVDLSALMAPQSGGGDHHGGGET